MKVNNQKNNEIEINIIMGLIINGSKAESSFDHHDEMHNQDDWYKGVCYVLQDK